MVVPTIGRPSLGVLLDALASASGPRPAELILVDDRPAGGPLSPARPGLPPVRVVRTGGGGPARGPQPRLADRPHASGSPSSTTTSCPDADWYERLDADLRRTCRPTSPAARAGCACPCRHDRRPTDWERGTAGLATSSWITADLAYRRAALAAVGGFDERFPRAFREDSDLALRVMAAGGRLVRGARGDHPPGAAGRPLGQRARAGRQRRRRPHAPAARPRLARRAPTPRVGRRPRHLAVTAAAVVALGLAAARRPRAAAVAAAAGWPAPPSSPGRGSRPARATAREVATMAAPARVIPPLATWHFLRGPVRHRRVGAVARAARRWCCSTATARSSTTSPTTATPTWVRPVPGARGGAGPAARPRACAVGVVTNQSGIARGLITRGAGATRSTPGSTSCSARSTPGGAARTAPTTAASCRKPAPGHGAGRARASSASTAGPLRGHRRHRRRRRGRAAAAGAARRSWCPTPVTRDVAEEVAAAARGRDRCPTAVDAGSSAGAPVTARTVLVVAAGQRRRRPAARAGGARRRRRRATG